MADSVIRRVTGRDQDPLESYRGRPAVNANGQPGTLYDELKSEEVGNSRWHKTIVIILILLFLLCLGAYFSPLGSLLFLGGRAGVGGGCGEGGCGGGEPEFCDATGCSALEATTVVTEGLTVGENDPSQPVDIYNENVTIQNGSTVSFAPGSNIVCPDPGFLNDCVDEGAAFSPTCEDDYAACNASSPLTAGGVAVTDELRLEANATLVFAAGSAVTCPTPDFLNDCVDEGGALPPTCDEHALCANFLVTGVDVAGGAVSLLVGADLVTTDGSTITVVQGASQVFQNGSTLVFDAGSDVQCPTPDFLNDCVSQPASQICATDYNQCNGADPFVVGQVNVNDGIQMAVGSNLEFLVGSSVTCPTPGFLNSCVDEGELTLGCDAFAACADFEIQGSTVTGGTTQYVDGADVNLFAGSVLTMGFNSTLAFGSGSSVMCPSPGFLNDCVDEAGGGAPACNDYQFCNNADPLQVAAADVSETLTIQSTGTLVFEAGALVTCPTPDFLNSCVNGTGGGGAPPTCTEHTACTDFEVTGMDVLGGTIDLLAGADLNVGTPGAELLISNGGRLYIPSTAGNNLIEDTVVLSDPSGNLNVLNDAEINIFAGPNPGVLNIAGNLNTVSGSALDFAAGTSATCDQPIFNPSSGCTAETPPRRLLAPVFLTFIAAGTTSSSIVFGVPDSSVTTLNTAPYAAPWITYTIEEQGLYSIVLQFSPDLPSGGDWAIQLRRTHRDFGTGNGLSAGGNAIFEHICQFNEGNVLQAPGGACTYNGYFHVDDTFRLFLNHPAQPGNYQIGDFNEYWERLEITRLTA